MEDNKNIPSLLKRFTKIKNIEYFVLLLAVAVIISLLSGLFQPSVPTGRQSNDIEATPPPSHLSTEQEQMGVVDEQEMKLKKVLSCIEGVGDVEVMITYKTGGEIIPAMNTIVSNTETEEHDRDGGIRLVTQTDSNSQPASIGTQDNDGALILKEIEPEINGVIVIAEGAEDLMVRIVLHRAVQTVLGLNADQVEVFVMEKNKFKE
jgi:stage III sporulation protein AG